MGCFYVFAQDIKSNLYFCYLQSGEKLFGLYDGTREGLKREVLKEKAIIMANEKFGLDLKWYGPKSKKSEDDEAEAILIGWSQIISQNHD